MNARYRVVAVVAATALLLVPTFALATIQDFSSEPAGKVVAGTLPGGGMSSGMDFPDFTLEVTNTGGGPNSLIVFDSANPTGGDLDLGSPNATCPGGGPGVGTGGEAGMPGENCVPVGNILCIAEDIVDTSPADGLVDDPDDEAGGGTVTFHFDEPVVIFNVTILDIDGETLDFLLEENGFLRGNVAATDLGDNSQQHLDLSTYGPVTCLELTFSSSGSISELEYFPASVSNLDKSWGEVKSDF